MSDSLFDFLKMLLTLSAPLFAVYLANRHNEKIKNIEIEHKLKLERQQEISRLKKDTLLYPLIEFLSKDLNAMQVTFGACVVDEKFEIDRTYNANMLKLETFILAYGDENLKEDFNKFTRIHVRLRTELLENNDREKAFQLLREGSQLASSLLKNVLELL